MTSSDLARIPASGPVVVTANHPFGLLDGTVLGALFTQVRPDVKILTNFWLAGIPDCMSIAFSLTPSENVGLRPETGAE